MNHINKKVLSLSGEMKQKLFHLLENGMSARHYNIQNVIEL